MGTIEWSVRRATPFSKIVKIWEVLHSSKHGVVGVFLHEFLLGNLVRNELHSSVAELSNSWSISGNKKEPLIFEHELLLRTARWDNKKVEWILRTREDPADLWDQQSKVTKNQVHEIPDQWMEDAVEFLQNGEANAD